jgi:hypothetical protein
MTIFYVHKFEAHPVWRSKVPIFISPTEKGIPIAPQALCLFNVYVNTLKSYSFTYYIYIYILTASPEARFRFPAPPEKK